MALSRIVASVLSLLGAALLSGRAEAQLARRGETQIVSDVAGVKRLPGLAYDPVHERFLVVWSLFPVGAAVVDADGAAVGSPFVVPETGAEASVCPRVAYAASADAFLVTWVEEEGGTSRIEARLVRPTDEGSPSFLGGDVIVSDGARPKHPESCPSVAWSEASETFLVVWSDVEGDLDVRARRLDASGAPIGDEMQVSTGGAFDAFPAVALGTASDTFVIAWAHEPVEGGSTISTRTVSAGGGALGSETILYASEYEHYPDIAYDPTRDRFLVVSWHIGPGPDLYGRFADPAGAPVGEVIPIAATEAFEGGDGVGVAYSREADGYVAVFQSDSTEIWAAFVDGEGSSEPSLEATRGARMGSYSPKVAAVAGAPRFIVATSADYDRIVTQVLEVPAAARPDAGTGLVDGGAGGDAAGARDASASGDAWRGADRPTSAVADGCACGVAQSSPVPAWLGALALIALVRLLGRRRSEVTGRPRVDACVR